MCKFVAIRHTFIKILNYFKFISEYDINIKFKIFENNNGCFSIITAFKLFARIKYICIKYYFIKTFLVLIPLKNIYLYWKRLMQSFKRLMFLLKV